MRRTLIVTNDFPPRRGGIQSFVHEVAIRQPAGSVVVYASDDDGSAEFDAAQPFPVVRHPTGLLVPTPAAGRRVVATARAHGCTAAWFGAAAPLALLASALRRAGVERIVATTHGHEVAWAMLPGARQALRRIGTQCDVVTYLGEYARRRLAPALGRHAMMRQLTPGVDVSRSGVAEHVVLTGAVPAGELATHYAAGDVFAMPCRTRRLGMDVEGLGVVFLEASALGLPVVVGDSGGAPDAVRDGETGYLVDGRDIDQIAERIAELLDDARLRAKFGEAGRRWVADEWQWDIVAARLRDLLDS